MGLCGGPGFSICFSSTMRVQPRGAGIRNRVGRSRFANAWRRRGLTMAGGSVPENCSNLVRSVSAIVSVLILASRCTGRLFDARSACQPWFSLALVCAGHLFAERVLGLARVPELLF